MLKFVTLALMGVFLLTPGLASADPYHFAGTGHYYEAVGGNFTWPDAKAAAEGRSYAGQTGYLATITSAEENAFLTNTVMPSGSEFKYWIGGSQPPGSPEPNGGWEWITGETWSYTNWYHKDGWQEPTNGDGNEDSLEIMYIPGSGSLEFLGYWNDKYGLNTGESNGYLVEYVPEPGTTAVLGLGVWLLSRRRNKGNR